MGGGGGGGEQFSQIVEFVKYLLHVALDFKKIIKEVV